MEFNIGERVRVKAYECIPEEIRSKSFVKNAGKDGEIVDKLWSAAEDKMVYRIHFDGMAKASATLFLDGTFDRISDLNKVTYLHEFEYLENLVVARFYEVDSDGNKREIGIGHGHIFHEGAYGIAQASSYALKKIMQKMEEN